MKLGAFECRVGMVLVPDAATWWAPHRGGVAVVNILYGALCAADQKDLKYIIAYSSVSHMGVVMLGLATMNAAGWNGAVYQMVAHGIMTGLFFALVGLVYERAHTRTIAKMGGFAHVMPVVAGFFTLAGLSSLGLPGTAGFVAEFMVFAGAAKGPHWWWSILGVVGAFVTAVYVLRAVKIIFWGPKPEGDFQHLSDAKSTEWAAPPPGHHAGGVCSLGCSSTSSTGQQLPARGAGEMGPDELGCSFSLDLLTPRRRFCWAPTPLRVPGRLLGWLTAGARRRFFCRHRALRPTRIWPWVLRWSSWWLPLNGLHDWLNTPRPRTNAPALLCE